MVTSCCSISGMRSSCDPYQTEDRLAVEQQSAFNYFVAIRDPGTIFGLVYGTSSRRYNSTSMIHIFLIWAYTIISFHALHNLILQIRLWDCPRRADLVTAPINRFWLQQLVREIDRDHFLSGKYSVLLPLNGGASKLICTWFKSRPMNVVTLWHSISQSNAYCTNS